MKYKHPEDPAQIITNAVDIFITVREPLVVLDKDLRVLVANQAFYKKFQATQNDTEGQYLYDLGNKQWNIPRLRQLLEEVLPKHQTFEDFRVEHDFQDIGPKIMLLNGREIYRHEHQDKMILLAIEDITEVVLAERKLHEAYSRIKTLLNNLKNPPTPVEK